MAEALQSLTPLQTTILGSLTGFIDVSCTQWMLYSKTLSQVRQGVLILKIKTHIVHIVQSPLTYLSLTSPAISSYCSAHQNIHSRIHSCKFTNLHTAICPLRQWLLLQMRHEPTHPNVPRLHYLPPKCVHPNRSPIPPHLPHHLPNNRRRKAPPDRRGDVRRGVHGGCHERLRVFAARACYDTAAELRGHAFGDSPRGR